MTSKNLYLAKWLENCKRRNWTFLLCLVSQFLLLPVSTGLMLSNCRGKIQQMEAEGAGRAALEEMRLQMQSMFSQQTGIGVPVVLLAIFFAVLFAVQGFSFLYSRQKMDLYMSVPVSAPKRFLLIWANGIAVFAGGYLACQVLSLLVGAAFGVADARALANAAAAAVFNLVGFAAVYHFALTAVMLTGNVLTALLGCGVLFLYEPVLRILFNELQTSYFVTYCRAASSRLMERSYLTPAVSLLLFSDKVTYTGSQMGIYADGEMVSALGPVCRETALLLGAAAVWGLVSYALFRKRKTESHGVAMAFARTKGAVRFLLLVPFGILAGLLVAVFFGQGFLWFGAVVGILIGHAVIQLIYERDLRAILKGKPALAAGFLASLGLLALFRFDLLGYDSFVPDQEEVAAVSVTVEHDYSGLGGHYQIPGIKGGYHTVADLLLSDMDSSDPDTVKAVLLMAETSRREREERGDEYASHSEMGEKMNCWVVRYRMQNGRQIYRRFWVDGADLGDAIDTVMRDESYRKLRIQVYDSDFEKAAGGMKVVYSDGLQDHLYTLDKGELLEALREDLCQYDYTLLSGQLPEGKLVWEISDPEAYMGYSCRWEYPIYSGFSKTKALLAQNGISAKRESFLQAEDVDSVQVEYYHYYGEGAGSRLQFDGSVPEQLVTCQFTKAGEIEELLQALYPRTLMDAVDQSLYMEDRFDYDFSVTLTLSESGRQKLNGTSSTLYLELIRDREPDFVEKKIKESATRG